MKQLTIQVFLLICFSKWCYATSSKEKITSYVFPKKNPQHSLLSQDLLNNVTTFSDEDDWEEEYDFSRVAQNNFLNTGSSAQALRFASIAEHKSIGEANSN